MKKRLLYLLLPIITLILEILPYGAVLHFGHLSPDLTLYEYTETFSYFDLIPFGYANITPLLTAAVTCIILILLLVYLFTGITKTITATKIFLCIGVALSLCPLLFGISYFSVVGALITISLISEFVLLLVTVTAQRNMKTV